MVQFIVDQGSPFNENSLLTLLNFVTKEQMTTDIREKLLNSSVKGKERYTNFEKKHLWKNLTGSVSPELSKSTKPKVHSMTER